MPTQVDWDWQIQHKPAGLGTWQGIFPTTALYGPGTFLIDQSTGLVVDSHGNLVATVADLTHFGMLNHSVQEIQGPKLFFGTLAASLPIPGTDGSGLITCGNSFAGLGFYSSADTDPPTGVMNANIRYAGSGNALTIECLTPHGGGILNLTAPEVAINGLLGGYGIFGAASAPQIYLHTPASGGQIFMQADNARLTLQGGLATSLDLTGLLGATAYSIQGNLGASGTTVEGDTVVGGLVTHVGGGGSIPLSGDVTGTTGASLLTNIQGNPVLAPSPSIGDSLTWNGTDWIPSPGGGIPFPSSPSLGDYLVWDGSAWNNYPSLYPVMLGTLSTGDVVTWNGTDWINAPASGGLAIGSPVSGGTPGETLQVDGSGNLGQWVPWLITQGSASVSCDGSGNVTATSAAPGNVTLTGPTGGVGNGLSLDANSAVFGNYGDHYIWFFYRDLLLDAYSTVLYMGPDYGMAITDTGYTFWNSDHSGNLSLCPTGGMQIGFFGAPPQGQYGGTGLVGGFTGGTGATVTVDSTFTGNFGSYAFTISDVVAALKGFGLLNPS